MTFPTISQKRVIQAILSKEIGQAVTMTVSHLNQLVDMFETEEQSAFSNLYMMLHDGVYRQEHPEIVRQFTQDLCQYAERLGRLDRLLFGKAEAIKAARE